MKKVLISWHIKTEMDIASLLDKYFPTAKTQVTIDVFDEKNVYSVYERVIGVLTQ